MSLGITTRSQSSHDETFLLTDCGFLNFQFADFRIRNFIHNFPMRLNYTTIKKLLKIKCRLHFRP